MIKRKDKQIIEAFMTYEERRAFILFLKHEKLRHQEDIYKIDEDIRRLENDKSTFCGG